jgi:hypothetical protein
LNPFGSFERRVLCPANPRREDCEAALKAVITRDRRPRPVPLTADQDVTVDCGILEVAPSEAF